MRKHYSPTGRSCRVTFRLAANLSVSTVSLCGDFNDWDPERHPMTRRRDGSFSTTITLAAGGRYRFRYLVDQSWWENDWAADGYVPNEFGTEDSVVVV